MVLDENAVCDALVKWLKGEGFADAKCVKAGRRGFDVECGPSSSGPGWIIEAKGGISSRSGNNSLPFKNGAVFNQVAQAYLTATSFRHHEKRNGRLIGLAIPTGGKFDTHSMRIEDACSILGITIFRVDEAENVRLHSPRDCGR
jgi:hypothetical protein